MAFIIKKKNYFELVENKRVAGIHKRKFLYYIGKELIIPLSIIDKYEVTEKNIGRLKLKYKDLRIADGNFYI